VTSWIGVAFVSVVIGVVVYGLRSDASVAVPEPAFVLQAVIAVVVMVAAVAATLTLAIPGAERTLLTRWLPVVLTVAWIVLAGRDVAAAGHGFSDASHWPICALRLVSVALLPGLLLAGMLRRSAPVRWGWTAALAAAASAAAGAIAVPFSCTIVTSSHIFLGHVAPVGVLAALAWAAAVRRTAL
jgi:hypothetical protein